jgi:hypothetical protein
MADRLGKLLDPYPSGLSFVHFLSLNPTAPAPLPPQHNIGNECTSWFGAIRDLLGAPVQFLNAAKLFIL